MNRRGSSWTTSGAVDQLLSIVLFAVLALPVAGLVTLLLGAAHAVDPAVPPLGWLACYLVILATWLVRWVTGVEMRIRLR